MRDQVYQYVFDSHVCIDLKAGGDNQRALRQKLQHRLSLLATCKQIRREGTKWSHDLPVVQFYIPVVEEFEQDPRELVLLNMVGDFEAVARAGLLDRGRVGFCLGRLRYEDPPKSFEDLYRGLYKFRKRIQATYFSSFRAFFDMRLQNGLTARFQCGYDRRTFSEEVKEAILFCGDVVSLTNAEEHNRGLLEIVLDSFWLGMR